MICLKIYPSFVRFYHLDSYEPSILIMEYVVYKRIKQTTEFRYNGSWMTLDKLLDADLKEDEKIAILFHLDELRNIKK